MRVLTTGTTIPNDLEVLIKLLGRLDRPGHVTHSTTIARKLLTMPEVPNLRVGRKSFQELCDLNLCRKRRRRALNRAHLTTLQDGPGSLRCHSTTYIHRHQTESLDAPKLCLLRQEGWSCKTAGCSNPFKSTLLFRTQAKQTWKYVEILEGIAAAHVLPNYPATGSRCPRKLGANGSRQWVKLHQPVWTIITRVRLPCGKRDEARCSDAAMQRCSDAASCLLLKTMQ